MARAAKHALVEQLIADGTQYIFGNPGTTEQGFMDALQDHPELQFVLALHEGVAVTMADAYARATRRPAFVELHTAPGLGNGIGMINNAARGHTPLVIYAGQADTHALPAEPWLGGDLVGMARPVVKWAAEAKYADEVPLLLRRAMKVAAEPPEGPVFLSLPLDVLEQQTSSAVAPTSFTRWHARPDESAVREAAALLALARRPVIVAGDGVATSQAHAELQELAALSGAAIYASGSEVNVLPDDPLWTGTFNQAVMAGPDRPDVVLMAGAIEASSFTGPVPLLPEGTHIIQIHTSTWELAKSNVVDVAIAAGVRETLAELIQLLRQQLSAEQAERAHQRAGTIAASRRAELDRLRREDEQRRDTAPIRPSRLWEELAGAMPAEAAMYAQAGTTAQSLDRYIHLPAGRLFRSRGGGLGSGLSGTLGVQLAFPDRPVIGAEGDGSAMYCISALWTAAHHNLPVTWIICNNGMYRVLKLNVLNHLGEAAAGRKFVEMDLRDPPINYARIAESMGVRGWRVERPADLAGALRDAIAHPGPALVDVVVDGSIPGRTD